MYDTTLISSTHQPPPGVSLRMFFCRLLKIAGLGTSNRDNPTNATGNVNSEKPVLEAEEAPISPRTGSTWGSQNDTIIPIEDEEEIVIEEDSDEESGNASSIARVPLHSFHKKHPPQKPHQASPSANPDGLERCELGYPYLAAFMDSDENFMIYRRFGFLHARLLLQKQDELRLMEEQLDLMDRRDVSDNPKALQCRMEDVDLEKQSYPQPHSQAQGSKTGAEEETRQGLLARMETAILRYDELLLNAQQLTAANRPPRRDYNSVANFVMYKKPLMQGDDDFIYNREDLITLRPGRESAWLDATVEKVLKLFPRSLVKHLFCSKETALKTTDPDLFFPTKSRVDRLVSFLIMTMVLALLVVPVYALYHVGSSYNEANANRSNAICMGILLVATLLFSAALALFTKAKRHELLGAAAAYCALLVVFIANLGFNGGN
ncbi:hypothetical protein BKA65DRAFT_565359 [Rhexocercosporidium sp. MPI-PUGE-AT-0058]|nr:hypothetical protein BKA65DRAFT_565359 [Rhexocercosporidium sp. MPI-PUGE-AT-0058]